MTVTNMWDYCINLEEQLTYFSEKILQAIILVFLGMLENIITGMQFDNK